MEIDWASMGWYHIGEWYTSASGHTYRLTERGWTNCPECLTLPPTDTTGVGVTISPASGATSATAVPEPSSALLLLLALAGVVLWRRCRGTESSSSWRRPSDGACPRTWRTTRA